MSEISNNERILSVPDITDRVDELREERAEHAKECLIVDPSYVTERDEDGKLTGDSLDDDGLPKYGTWEEQNPDESEELENLETLLDALSDMGFSHEWDGKKYPDALIANYHFTDYVQEMAEDQGAVSREASWIVIDWKATADGVKQDYRQVDYDGNTYWYRG